MTVLMRELKANSNFPGERQTAAPQCPVIAES
jgi:hypothetical protein